MAWSRCCGGSKSGEVQVLTRDLPHPSMLAMEILNARAPMPTSMMRRWKSGARQAVAARRWLDPQSAAEFGRLDPAGHRAAARGSMAGSGNRRRTARCADAARCPARSRRQRPGASRAPGLDAVVRVAARSSGAPRALRRWRACILGGRRTVAAGAWPSTPMAQPRAGTSIHRPATRATCERSDAMRELLRGRLQAIGPVTATALDATLALPMASAMAALLALEGEGFVLRGQFTNPAARDRRARQRAMPPNLNGASGACWRASTATPSRTLRAQIEPVASADFMRFLLEWQGVTREPKGEGPQSLAAVLEQLEGFEVPAIAWERDVLPARLQHYDPGLARYTVPFRPRAVGAAGCTQGLGCRARARHAHRAAVARASSAVARALAAPAAASDALLLRAGHRRATRLRAALRSSMN